MLDAVVLAVGLTVAGIGFPASVDSGFADRLMTAIGARTNGGTVACTIPGDLRPGRRFECHGVDASGGYTVEVTILDRRDHFQLAFARAI